MEDLGVFGQVLYIAIITVGFIAQVAYTVSAPDIGRGIKFDNLITDVPLSIIHILAALGLIFFGTLAAARFVFGLPIPI